MWYLMIHLPPIHVPNRTSSKERELLRKWISILLIVVGLAIGGCTGISPGGTPNPGTKLLQGQVVFEGVEGLGLWSERVVIDDQVVSTDDNGRFTINKL